MSENGHHPDHDAALRWAGDEGRLLPGEDPRSAHVEDALHWVKVYVELRRLKAEMIGETERERGRVPEQGQIEVELDLELLRVQSERLDKRLEFWRQRGLELDGKP